MAVLIMLSGLAVCGIVISGLQAVLLIAVLFRLDQAITWKEG